ncbi:MAG: ClpXP protease specificity-enhancing factor [Burkholderiaceae bacterium]
MTPSAAESASTRPYLIRALYEWCTDHGFTPYVAVLVDETVQVPMEYVRNGEIVLNISPEATSALRLGNDFIEFKARFAGTARDIMVPVGRVIAIYARENGQGMAFPTPPAAPTSASPVTATSAGGKAPRAAIVSTGAAASAASAASSAPAAADEARAGMQLVVTSPAALATAPTSDAAPAGGGAPALSGTEAPGAQPDPDSPRPPGGGRPALKRIK